MRFYHSSARQKTDGEEKERLSLKKRQYKDLAMVRQPTVLLFSSSSLSSNEGQWACDVTGRLPLNIHRRVR